MQINKCFYCMEDMPQGQATCPHCGRRVGQKPQPEYALPYGTILHGKYLIGAMMGEGGFGITYIGFDLLLRSKVAIKEYFPNKMANRGTNGNVLWSTYGIPKEQGCKNFLSEARKMAILKDIPEVVRVLDMPEENNTAYIVMDFIEGITLKDEVKRVKVMSCDAAVTLLEPVIRAMGKVNARGIIHRDISPDNIMLDRDGNARILDLGAAKEIDTCTEEGVQSSQLIHKDGFSPPEQYAQGGEIGAWTDIYAMSATIYYCVTGKVVPQAMDRIIYNKPVVFTEKVPQAIQTVLLKGLSVNAKQRYQSMDMLADALEEALQSDKKHAPRKNKKLKWLIAGAAAALVVLIGVLAVSNRGKTPDADAPTEDSVQAAEIMTEPSTPPNVESIVIRYNDTQTEDITTYVGDPDITLNAVIYPRNDYETVINWSSSDETVLKVTVNANGEAVCSAVSEGIATLTAEVSGVTAECLFRVHDPSSTSSPVPENKAAITSDESRPVSAAAQTGDVVASGTYEQDNDTGNGWSADSTPSTTSSSGSSSDTSGASASSSDTSGTTTDQECIQAPDISRDDTDGQSYEAPPQAHDDGVDFE